MAELENRHKRTPSDEEVASELGITVGEFEESLTQIARSSVVALDELWSGSRAGGESAALIQDEMRQALTQGITRLPDRERLVVTLYYYEKLTLREIGEVLSITESCVSQLHTKAILRLRVRLRGSLDAAIGGGSATVVPETARSVVRGPSSAHMPGMTNSPDRGWRQALNKLAAALAETRHDHLDAA
jgi:RNA polymerase sigma factor (sigma-70 family)